MLASASVIQSESESKSESESNICTEQTGGGELYLAQNLKYLREQKGLNQADLAKILGVKQPTVGNWEVGKREPDIDMLIRLAEYFDVTLDDIVLKDLRPPASRYAENILYLRKRHGLSQMDIGQLLKVTQKCVSKYEKGESAVDVEKLMKLADFFGVTLDQLVKQDLSKEQ